MSGECNNIASYFVIHDRILVHMNTSTPLPLPLHAHSYIVGVSFIGGALSPSNWNIVESGIKHHNPNPSPMQ